MTLTSRFGATFAAVALLFVAGCGGGGSNSGPSVDKPSYRLINASPDTPALDFIINDDKRGSAIAYGGSTTDFKSLKADLYDVTLHPTGAAQDAWSEAVNFQNEQNYALVAFGLSNFGDEYYKRLRLAVVPIERSQPNGSRARLVVVNAFNRQPGFDDVSVDFKNPGDNPQYALRDIGIGGFSNLDLDAGTHTFELRLSDAEQVFVTKNLNLESGKIYAVLLTGVEGGTGDQAPDIKLIELQTED